MSEHYYKPRVGDRVKFTLPARRQKFWGGVADGRRRMTVVGINPYGDAVLDDGEQWAGCWLEPVGD